MKVLRLWEIREGQARNWFKSLRFQELSITINTEKNMEAASTGAQDLRKQISALEAQLQKLKGDLAQVEASDTVHCGSPVTRLTGKTWPLSQEEYKRYGRQMIVPSFGIQGLCCVFTIVSQN